MGHMTATLAAILRAKSVSIQKDAPHVWSACNGELNISFYRNDYLDILTKSVRATQCDGEDHFSKCIAFAQDPILRRFDTLVVNSGTHPTAGGIDAYREKMNATSAVLTASMTRFHGENAILVIRNTSPGHSECLKR